MTALSILACLTCLAAMQISPDILIVKNVNMEETQIKLEQ